MTVAVLTPLPALHAVGVWLLFEACLCCAVLLGLHAQVRVLCTNHLSWRREQLGCC